MNYIDPIPKDSVKSRGFGAGDVEQAAAVKNSNWDNELDDSEEYRKPLTKSELESLLYCTYWIL